MNKIDGNKSNRWELFLAYGNFPHAASWLVDACVACVRYRTCSNCLRWPILALASLALRQAGNRPARALQHDECAVLLADVSCSCFIILAINFATAAIFVYCNVQFCKRVRLLAHIPSWDHDTLNIYLVLDLWSGGVFRLVDLRLIVYILVFQWIRNPYNIHCKQISTRLPDNTLHTSYGWSLLLVMSR